MMEQIISSTKDAVQLMLNTLRTMKLLMKFQGENVYTAVSQVCGVINRRLKSLSMSRVPSDIVHQELNEIFERMLTLSKLETFKLQIGGQSDLAMMVESILEDATQNIMHQSKLLTRSGSKHGHIKRDCPEATKKQRSEWKEMSRNHTSGGGCGGGRGCNSGGCGKGGGNKGNKKDNGKGGSKYSTSGQFRYPKAGEGTHEILGNLCYPCSHYGWNQEHSTDNHTNAGGGSGKKSTSTTPKKSNDGDFAKNVALAIQGIANDAPAAFSLLFNGIQKAGGYCTGRPLPGYPLSPAEVDHTTQLEVTRIMLGTRMPRIHVEPIGTERKAQHRTNDVHGKHELANHGGDVFSSH
eukprot:scaffold80439_cov53-Attheya_sp.AAC.3